MELVLGTQYSQYSQYSHYSQYSQYSPLLSVLLSTLDFTFQHLLLLL